ncbi:MAG: CvpA family protein [Pseudomonadota bacterium]
MNWADWVIIAILTISCLIGLVRGFFKEVFSLVIWIAAVIIANLFSDRLALLLVNIIATPSLRAMTAFLAIFVAVLLIGMLINYGVNLLVNATGLSVSNRLLGMCFGFVRGFFIVMILLIYLPSFIPVKKDSWFQQSLVIPYLVPYEAAVKRMTGEISHWLLNFMAKPPSVQV